MKGRTPRFSARTRGDARRVVQAVVAHHAERLWSFEAAARLGVEPEGVHQMRVQTRRLRAVLRLARGVLPRGVAQSLRRQLATLGSKLGAERDVDVLGLLLTSLAERFDDPVVKRTLTRQRKRCLVAKAHAHTELVLYLDSKAAVGLRARLSAVALGADAAPVRGKAMPAAPFAAQGIAELLGRVRRRAKKARGHEPEPLHALRRALKNLRYAVEALSALLPSASRSLARRAAWLQDRLGSIHDLDIAAGLIGPNKRVSARLAQDRDALREGVARRVRRVLDAKRDPTR